MFVIPGTVGQRLTRAAAERMASNWWLLLLNGIVLVVAGFLIFSIDWTIRELATFIGALFVFEGVAYGLTTGIDTRVRIANVLAGVLSIAAGITIIVWPGPGLVMLAIFLAGWLIVSGTMQVAGAFAVRRILPSWWMLLLLGLLEIPLGVLALADPGASLAAIITVGGIWGVAVGAGQIVLGFELKRLADIVDEAVVGPVADGPGVRWARTPSPVPRA